MDILPPKELSAIEKERAFKRNAGVSVLNG